MTIYSSILAWKILWTGESGGLQSMGLQRVGHNLATEQKQQKQVYYLGTQSRLILMQINV